MAGRTDNAGIPTFLRGLPLALEAFRFAREAHREQRRESDAAQFIVHPLEVASLLHNTGHSDQLVAAGILHDTIEKSTATAGSISARFGEDVAAIVAAMSEDPAIRGFEERKAALRRQIAGVASEAPAVYAADKVAKVRELRSRAVRGDHVLEPNNTAGAAKLEHYLASLAMLEEISPDDPLVRQLRFELEMLDALPPRPDLL